MIFTYALMRHESAFWKKVDRWAQLLAKSGYKELAFEYKAEMREQLRRGGGKAPTYEIAVLTPATDFISIAHRGNSDFPIPEEIQREQVQERRELIMSAKNTRERRF